MQRYEYRVVPAPKRGEKARGVKTTDERFALALTSLMNEYGAEGWDYLRTDTLPCEERSGLTGTKTSFQHMLVFRRALAQPAVTAPMPAAVPALPEPVAIAALPASGEADTPLSPVPTAAEPRPLRLGAATAPEPAAKGGSPAIGPARPEVAAE